MSLLLKSFFLFALLVAGNANTVSRVAVATLTSHSAATQPGPDIFGHILFTEINNSLHISGNIRGLPAGRYGFHVHELGDVNTCDTSGAHFNPDDTNHGGRNHTVRHVGDLGNVVFVSDDTTADAGAVANLDITDSVLTLRGRNSIIGRTLVLHAQEDDYGLGGDSTSLTTGNAGPRVACGVIGLKFPSDPWNAASTTLPSPFLFALVSAVIYFLDIK